MATRLEQIAALKAKLGEAGRNANIKAQAEALGNVVGTAITNTTKSTVEVTKDSVGGFSKGFITGFSEQWELRTLQRREALLELPK